MKHWWQTIIVPAFVALFIVGSSNAAMWQWSKTSSSNSNADPTINWAEGMSPSSVNDSARAMMARLADWRDDISGALTTGGTGTAYTLTSNQVFTSTANMNNAMIAFIPNTTNTGNVTLAVDGLTAKPIRSQTGSSGNLGAGVLIQGTPYVATYYDSVGEFILQGFVGNPYAVPLGSFMFHSTSTVPNSNFVLPYGQAISRTTYAAYFAMVGTTFGPGDGVTTFNVPDIRGRFIAGWDAMGGVSASRLTTAASGVDGGTIGAVGGAQSTTLITANLPAYTPAGSIGITDPGHSHPSSVAVTETVTNAAGTNAAWLRQGSSGYTSFAPANTTGISASFTGTAQGGTSTSFTNVGPTIVLPIMLRIQ